MSERSPPGRRADYKHFHPMPTRWMDNDVYGHVNNVTFLSYADTAVNRYLIDVGKLNFHSDPVIGIMVETMCRFHKSIAYPDLIECGLRIGRLGSSSVRYEVGMFVAPDDVARAEAHCVHVFVERATNKPVPIPDKIRTALARIQRS